MKIFALNLCLEFVVKDPAQPYEVDLMPFDALMSRFFKGIDFRGQVFFVQAHMNPDLVEHLFALQASEVFRHIEAKVVLVFPSAEGLNQFVHKWSARFRKVDAAGGLVQNEAGEYLCIYSRSRWSFPKGHVEWQEPVDEAAIREVQEETGLRHLELLAPVPGTLHTYRHNQHWTLKTTHWFRMLAPGNQALTPQHEEGIEQVAWIGREEWAAISDESYPLIRHLMRTELFPPLL